MNNAYETGLSRDAASFASFLENLATPETDRWDCGELAEDVATICSVHPGTTGSGVLLSQVSESRAGAASCMLDPGSRVEATGQAQRKRSSVTIRMTQAECDQLQRRASAAGLTVSAYLRSCIFEAEALRAQVKEALAQFNAAKEQPPMETPTIERRGCKARGGRVRFGAGIFSRWAAHRHAAPD